MHGVRDPGTGCGGLRYRCGCVWIQGAKLCCDHCVCSSLNLNEIRRAPFRDGIKTLPKWSRTHIPRILVSLNCQVNGRCAHLGDTRRMTRYTRWMAHPVCSRRCSDWCGHKTDSPLIRAAAAAAGTVKARKLSMCNACWGSNGAVLWFSGVGREEGEAGATLFTDLEKTTPFYKKINMQWHVVLAKATPRNSCCNLPSQHVARGILRLRNPNASRGGSRHSFLTQRTVSTLQTGALRRARAYVCVCIH